VSSAATPRPSRGARPGTKILDTILARLAAGALKKGDRLPPERALAKQYGVGLRAVRGPLAELERRGVLTRRQGSGTYVARVPRELFARRVGVAHLVESWVGGNLLFSGIHHEIVSALRGRGHKAVFFPMSERDVLTTEVTDAGLDALLFVNIPRTAAYEAVEAHGVQPISVYYVPRLDDPAFAGYGVYPDPFPGMVALVGKLKALGHRRVALLGAYTRTPAPELQRNRQQQTRAFFFAMESHGLVAPAPLVHELTTENSGALGPIRRILELKRRPTAVLTDGPDHLRPLLQVAASLKLGIPRDLTVVALSWPQDEVSSLLVTPQQYADAAMHVLEARLAGAEPVSRVIGIPPHLNHERTIAPSRA
jgi:DNA-binding LacI/PurR family transcriptional regulator